LIFRPLHAIPSRYTVTASAPSVRHHCGGYGPAASKDAPAAGGSDAPMPSMTVGAELIPRVCARRRVCCCPRGPLRLAAAADLAWVDWEDGVRPDALPRATRRWCYLHGRIQAIGSRIGIERP
jgi:hypothetical protein